MPNLRWNQDDFQENRDSAGTTSDSFGDHSGDLQQGYPLGSLTDGLVAYYPFDGDTKDHALNNDGTETSALSFVNDSTRDEVAESDGSSEISLGEPASMDAPNEFTIAAWVKFAALNQIQSIFSKGPAADTRSYELLHANHNSEITFFVRGKSSNHSVGFAESNTSIGTWHLLTATWSESNGKIAIYLDDTEMDSATHSDTVVNDNYNTYISNGNNGRHLSNGTRIDDIRFYDRALSLPEIKALYQRTSTQAITDQDRLTAGLVGHWPLNEDTASTAYDLSGRGNDSTSVTGTTVTTGIGGAKARRFDGNDEFIEIGKAVLGISSDFSVNFWLNPDDVTPSDEMQLIMENGRDVTSTIKSGEVRFRVYDGSNNYQSHYNISEDEWTMLTATWDYSNNTLKFYKNAVDSPAGSNKANGNAGHTGFRIGDHPSSGYGGYKGTIADLRAYNRVLTKSEIETLVRQGGL